MSLKIYSYPNNPRVWKAVIASKYVGVEIEQPPFQIGVDNKTKEFAEKNPVQKVPVLETPEGCIFESNAIARYVARQNNSRIYGSNAFEASLIDQWIDFSVNEIELPSAAWLFPILEIVPFNKEATARAKTDIRKALEILNKHLTYRTFLVGERISLADIVVSMSLYRLFKMVLDPGFRKPFANLLRWYLTCVNQPEFKAVIGEVQLCDKMLQAKLPPKEETKKEEKPAQPKQKPKAEEKKKEKEEDEEEHEEKKPKAKSALELLPPTKLDLDEWKRTYSNLDIRGQALPWFWEHFDPEGWSIWFSHYKYNNELSKLFMTNNLVGGFLQRCDKLRKWGFGSLLIFGEEPKLEVSGCWLIRGTVLPEELFDNPDWEHYEWVKADPNDPATRKLIENYWAWNGDFGGKVFHEEGKVFK